MLWNEFEPPWAQEKTKCISLLNDIRLLLTWGVEEEEENIDLYFNENFNRKLNGKQSERNVPANMWLDALRLPVLPFRRRYTLSSFTAFVWFKQNNTTLSFNISPNW